jgi:hypothetical protein
MKLTIALLLIFTFQVNAKSFAQRVTISKTQVSLATVFKDIEKQTGFLFFYDKALVAKARPCNAEYKKPGARRNIVAMPERSAADLHHSQ